MELFFAGVTKRERERERERERAALTIIAVDSNKWKCHNNADKTWHDITHLDWTQNTFA